MMQSWTIKSATTAAPPATAKGAGLAGPYTAQAGILGYYEICLNVKNNGWFVVQDPSAKMGPYAYSKANLNWVGYDDPTFAIVKSKYVLSMGIGGAMVWDISTDDFGNSCGGGANPIMTAISQTILSNQPATTGSPVTTSTQGTTGKTTATIPSTSSTTAKSTTTNKSATTISTTSTTSKLITTTTNKAATSATNSKGTTKTGGTCTSN